ncbi:MAG: hypothetical protein LBP62_07210 [Clostridiales bacterium]|jgi:hypothetical protein|nr:hypothetical protein [Clostridiales bacterium]
MSRESKLIECQKEDKQQIIYDYESFGWELLSVTEKGIALSRETQNPVYGDLLKYQIQYENTQEQINKLKNTTILFQFEEMKEKPKTKLINVLIIIMISAIVITSAMSSNITVYPVIISLSLIAYKIIAYYKYDTYKKEYQEKYAQAEQEYAGQLRIRYQKITDLEEIKKQTVNDSRATFFAKAKE